MAAIFAAEFIDIFELAFLLRGMSSDAGANELKNKLFNFHPKSLNTRVSSLLWCFNSARMVLFGISDGIIPPFTHLDIPFHEIVVAVHRRWCWGRRRRSSWWHLQRVLSCWQNPCLLTNFNSIKDSSTRFQSFIKIASFWWTNRISRNESYLSWSLIELTDRAAPSGLSSLDPPALIWPSFCLWNFSWSESTTEFKFTGVVVEVEFEDALADLRT